MKIKICFHLFPLLLPCILSAQIGREATQLDKLDVQTLRKPDGLHTLAIRHGGSFVQAVQSVPFVRRDSLADLAKDSDLVVGVHIVDNRCELMNEGRSIVTGYHAEVDQVFDRSARTGYGIQVVIPGGRFRFDDGTWAQVNWAHQEPMLNKHRYILFLRKMDDGRFAPVGVDEGVFEMTANDQIRPLVWDKRSPLAHEGGFTLREFQERVTRAAIR